MYRVPLAAHVPGSGISKKQLGDLARSGIAEETALSLGVRTSQAGDSIVIPRYDLQGEKILSLIVRYDNEAVQANRYPKQKKKRTPKYCYLGDQGLYYPHLKSIPPWSEIAVDRKVPIYFTEGIKQAAKLSQEGFPAVALNGVSVSGKEHELDCFRLQDRQVFLVLDADKSFNANLQRSEQKLIQELEGRGAKVHCVSVPKFDSNPKAGIDDYLADGINSDSSARAKFDALLLLARNAI